MQFNFTSIVQALIPVLLTVIAWAVSSIGDLRNDITKLQGNMMMLVDPNGHIVPSPENALARQKLKEEMVEKISELKVKVQLLEERERLKK